jgi:hypothetical protein
VSAAPRVSGAVGGLLGASIHRIGAGQQLRGAALLGLRGGLVADRGRSVEVGLLVIEQRLVFVTRTLCIIEHVLRRRAPRLRQPRLGLTGRSLGDETGVAPAGMDLAIQQGLLLVEAVLVTVTDRLLAVSESLFEAGDALIGVKVLLCAVRHAFTAPFGS